MKKLVTILLASTIAISAIAGDLPKNAVNIHLLSLATGNLQLKYERAFARNLSFVVNAGIMPKTDAPGSLNMTGATMNGWSFTPEFRIYAGAKGSPKGFYVAPYLRFDKYSLAYDESFVDPIMGNVDFSIKGSLSQVPHGGVMIGTQWLIAKRVTFDWYFLALGVSRRVISFEAETNMAGVNLDEFGDDIESSLKDIPQVGDKVKAEIEPDRIKVSVPVMTPGTRWGFSLGVAF